MTRDVVSVSEDTPVPEIVRILETRKIKRVLVVRDMKLVGIVSRADFVQALATKTKSVSTQRVPDDHEIRRHVLAELTHQSWWKRNSSNVIVTDGVVHYWGLVGSEDEKQAAQVAAENVPGVRKVEDHRMRLVDLPSML